MYFQVEIIGKKNVIQENSNKNRLKITKLHELLRIKWKNDIKQRKHDVFNVYIPFIYMEIVWRQ